jgi:hypothetical protein
LSEYYKTSIKCIQANDPDATFVLFSDEPSKIPLTITAMEKTVIAPLIGTWETLWQMSRFNGGICANSSFSWTAAWALRGPVYMPQKWKKIEGFVKALPSWALII